MSQKIGLSRVRRTWTMESSSSSSTREAISRVKLQNPFVLRVGQVMTGFGVGCGLGIGVGVPIPMGNSLSTFQFRRLICIPMPRYRHFPQVFCRPVAFGRVENILVCIPSLGLL